MAFTKNSREVGEAAFNQIATNHANSYFGFKHSLDQSVLVNMEKLSLTFKMTQILAMLFAHLKSFVKINSADDSVDCVIAYPSYFNTTQRNVILVAAGVAGLNCISMIKETTAVATNYAFNKKFKEPINVVFIDFGHSSLQICISKLTAEKIEVLTEAFAIIGGRDIDERMANYFINRLSNPKFTKENISFYFGLLNEVEVLKKKLTLSVDSFPLNLNLLIRDDTVSLALDRSEMETLCKDIFDQVNQLMIDTLRMSGLSLDNIHSIELVGGSSRIPKVKDMVREVFGKTASVTMNQDEAVAKGCILKFLSSTSNRKLEILEFVNLQSDKYQNNLSEKNWIKTKDVSTYKHFFFCLKDHQKKKFRNIIQIPI